MPRRTGSTYNAEQRRVAAASLYLMSKQLRTIRKLLRLKTFDRDHFFLLVLVYVTYHSQESLSVTGLARHIDRTWPTTKDKLNDLKTFRLVAFDDSDEDDRTWSIRPGEDLLRVVESILDPLMDMLMMSVNLIVAQGSRRRRLPKDAVREFSEQVSKISRVNVDPKQ